MAAVRIYIAGDSIIDGTGSPAGGCRTWLHDNIVRMGWFPNWQAPRATNNPAGYSFLLHDGLSGRTAATYKTQIAALMTTWFPDILILQIGTNDLNGGASVATTTADVVACWDAAWTSLPDLQIISWAVPSPFGSGFVVQVNNNLADEARLRRIAGKKCNFYENGNLLIAGEQADALHPNLAGYQFMGDEGARGLNSWHQGPFKRWAR